EQWISKLVDKIIFADVLTSLQQRQFGAGELYYITKRGEHFYLRYKEKITGRVSEELIKAAPDDPESASPANVLLHASRLILENRNDLSILNIMNILKHCGTHNANPSEFNDYARAFVLTYLVRRSYDRHEWEKVIKSTVLYGSSYVFGRQSEMGYSTSPAYV